MAVSAGLSRAKCCYSRSRKRQRHVNDVSCTPVCTQSTYGKPELSVCVRARPPARVKNPVYHSLAVDLLRVCTESSLTGTIVELECRSRR